MAGKKRKKLNAQPKSITLRSPPEVWEMLLELCHYRSREAGKAQSGNHVVNTIIREEYDRVFGGKGRLAVAR